ncbi:hypothetical protein EB001_20085 [bacterium]|nr:hypothetical protein [bacterium]
MSGKEPVKDNLVQEANVAAAADNEGALTAVGVDGMAGTTPATNMNSSCESKTNKWKCWIDRAVDLFDDFYFSNTDLTFKMKEDKTSSFNERAKYIVANFDSVINSDNVNTYENYEESYKADKYGLWREGERFTPILYLAKASPICAKQMLLILLKKGADLTLLASTRGCLFGRKCTSVGKLARKFYNYYHQGKLSLVPKTIEMYKSLKELSMGTFTDLSEKPAYKYSIKNVPGTSVFSERFTGVTSLGKSITGNIVARGAFAGALMSTVVLPPLLIGGAIAGAISYTIGFALISISFMEFIHGRGSSLSGIASRIIGSYGIFNKHKLRNSSLMLIKEVEGKLTEAQQEVLATGAIEQIKAAASQEKQAQEEEKKLVKEQSNREVDTATGTNTRKEIQILGAQLENVAKNPKEIVITLRKAVEELNLPDKDREVLALFAEQVEKGTTAATATEFNAGVNRLHIRTNKPGLQPLQINQRGRLTSDQFVPILENVLTNTEQVTLIATQALKGQGIEKEVEKFEKDVKRKIAETRARLNGLPANAVALAPGLGGPAPGKGGPPALVTPGTNFSSPNYKLNLLKVLNESLIHTIQEVITQMGAGNTDSVRRMLGYIQTLLIQLQKLVVVFNGLDNRMGNIEERLGMDRNTSTNTSQSELEALRTQLKQLMLLAPTAPAPAGTELLRNNLPIKKGGYSRKLSKTKRKTPAKTRKRVGHKKASRKNRGS